eukprot:g34463.t1
MSSKGQSKDKSSTEADSPTRNQYPAGSATGLFLQRLEPNPNPPAPLQVQRECEHDYDLMMPRIRSSAVLLRLGEA